MRWTRIPRLVTGFILLAVPVLQPGSAGATFPGANGKFAVEIESGPYSDQIVILNPDGSFSHYFPSFEDVHHGDPNWSPDGRLIAFSYDFRIAVAKPDGSDLAELTDGPDEAPKWAPDQTKILFVSGRDGNSEIYVMNADGGGQTNLTDDPAPDGGAQWAPNGTRIAFSSGRQQTSDVSGIYVMNSDGSGQARVSHNVVRNFLFREALYSLVRR